MTPNQQPNLNQEIIDVLVKERKSSRRWKNVRFFGWMFIFVLYAVLIFGPSGTTDITTKPSDPYVALINLNGVIMPNTNFSADTVLPELKKAFEDKEAKGVVLVINSPGGSPVQAGIIHDKIMELKKQHNKKVVIVGVDALASGAYLIATAGDKIYVHPDTLTGSIGVIMSGFGFTDAMEKVGVTRRVFTAGQNKDRLDPFKPLAAADIAKVNEVLNVAHENFIQYVVQGRGNRLKGDPQELFSGDFWTGTTAVKLGLADGTGNVWEIMKTEYNVSHYRDYTSKPSIVQMLLGDMGAELNLKLLNQTPSLQASLENN